MDATVEQLLDRSIVSYQAVFSQIVSQIRVSPKAPPDAVASPEQVHQARALMGGLQ